MNQILFSFFLLVPQKFDESRNGFDKSFYGTTTNWELLNSISDKILMLYMILGGYNNWVEHFLLGYGILASNSCVTIGLIMKNT